MAKIRWKDNQGPPRLPTIPNLTTPDGTVTTTMAEIETALSDSFFPPLRDADLSDAHGPYPDPLPFREITKHEIRKAITNMSSGKANGPDDIPVEALKKSIGGQPEEGLITALHNLYNASVRLGYCPQHFRASTTVPLRKTDKKEDTPKSYRPIALLNTMGKVLEAIFSERLPYLFDKRDLLPTNHIGGRKGHSCDMALLALIEIIYKAWNKGLVVTLLSLDVTGAFDHVSHARLLHILRMMGLGGAWAA